MSKQLCKSKKARRNEKEAAKDPNYLGKHICRKCKRLSAKKKSLCKPERAE
ncbi:MAG: hypothetical protein ACKVH8_00250 [Pirellulales bacterium]